MNMAARGGGVGWWVRNVTQAAGEPNERNVTSVAVRETRAGKGHAAAKGSNCRARMPAGSGRQSGA